MNIPDFISGQHKGVILDFVSESGRLRLDGAFFKRLKKDFGITRTCAHRAINDLVLDRKIKFLRLAESLSVVEVRQ